MRRTTSMLLMMLLAGILMVAAQEAVINVRASPDLPSDMPVIFVDPIDPFVNPGDNLTISVKIFNLTDCDLYGFGIDLTWDPTILEYVSHELTIPVEDYPDGTLHETVITVADTVNETGGTYESAASSLTPALGFNNPDNNSTVFNMTFSALAQGICTLDIILSDLADENASAIQNTVIDSDVTVIPEFPSVVFLPLLMTAALLMVLIHRRKKFAKTT